MSTEANKKTIEQLFRIEDGDVEAKRPFFADDIIWWMPVSATRIMKFDRPLKGWDAIPGLGRAFDAFEPGSSTFHLHHLVAEDDLVTVHFNRTARLSDGSPYDTEYNMLFRFQDGLIVEVWEVADTATAFGSGRRRESPA